MKKILFVVSTLKNSGPVIVVSNIIKYLDREVYEPVILTLSPEKNDSLKEYFKNELGVKVFGLGLSRLEGLFKAKKKYNNFLKSQAVDLVHSHGLRADWLIRGSEIPTVSTLHNYPFEDYRFNYGRLLGGGVARVHLQLLKSIDMPLAVSKTISEALNYNHGVNIGYIRNGTDCEKFKVRDKGPLRERLGLPLDKKIFLFVGHLSELKDPLTVMKAFKMAGLSRSHLILLGDGDLKRECEEYSINDSDTAILGRVNNVEDYFSACDFYISSSLTESFQLTVSEAIFSELYCFLSDIPVRKELLSLGLDFQLFEPGNYLQLSEKIIRCAEDSRLSQKVVKNREVAKEFLTADLMSNNYQELYAKLL